MIKNILSFSRSVIPAIESTKSLMQLFVVILFFENFSLLFYKKTLWTLNIQFKQIELKPFLCFFFFLAVSKMLWFAVDTAKNFLSRENEDDLKIDGQSSFLMFVLSILIFCYLFIIDGRQELTPVAESGIFLRGLYKSALALPAIIMGLGFLIAKRA